MTLVEQQVLQMVSELARLPVTNIRPEHRLRSDLGLDSLRAMELLALLADRLGVELTIEEGVELETIGALLDAVRERGRGAT
jgi:acyl carrier protein